MNAELFLVSLFYVTVVHIVSYLYELDLLSIVFNTELFF